MPQPTSEAGDRPARGEASEERMDSTGDAPPFRAPLVSPPLPDAALASPRMPEPGERLDDFELLRLLGTGSFGRVFLARQSSLDRLVALKVTARRDQEGRTLARLEHKHIVHVFSEVVLPLRGLRLLCMQYVPGATLAAVITALASRNRDHWSGQAILEIVDAASTDPVALDPAALRDREHLARCDFVEATCWIGARLAEALGHAHRLGVLHLDVKPANVLLNRYGRPLLADFNIAVATGPEMDPVPLGGTIAYMGPEHLEAFMPDSGVSPETVREPADIFSLGVVLFEMLTGTLPFSHHGSGPLRSSDSLKALAAARRGALLPFPAGSAVPGPVAGLVRRCLDPDPAQRYPSADDLSRALDGCCELRAIGKSIPAAGPLTRALLRHPFLMCCVLLLVPHLIGSLVNQSYRSLRILYQLTPEQQAVYHAAVPAYTLVVYPSLVVWMIVLLRPVRRIRQALAGPAPPSNEAVIAARRKALRLPLWIVVVSCLGWLPGGLYFPLVIHAWSGPLGADLFVHFLISCTLSGLIALTYSYFAAQFVVLRFLYPALWTAQPDVKSTVRAELAGLDRQLMLFQALAVLIPLTGAVLLVSVGLEGFGEEYQTFRLLVTGLIVAGMAGLGVTFAVGRLLQETYHAMTGDERGRI